MTNIIALAPPSPRHFPQVGEPAHGNGFPILGGEIQTLGSFLLRTGYVAYTSWTFSKHPALPPSIPLIKGGRIWTGSLPFIGGGLGWGSAESSSLDSSVILGLCIHRSDSGEF